MANRHIRLGPCPICRKETRRDEKLEHSVGIEFHCPYKHSFELQISDGLGEVVLVLRSDPAQRWLIHFEGFVLQSS